MTTADAAGHTIRVCVSPTGRLEDGRSAAFRRALALLTVLPGAEVTVDLTAVPYMDDVCAHSLAEGQSRLRGHDGRLTVARPRRQPREALLGLGVTPDARYA